MGKSRTETMTYTRPCVYSRGWIDTRKPYGWGYTQDHARVHDACARQWVQETNAAMASQHRAMAEAYEAQRSDPVLETRQALEIERDALEAEADKDDEELP